jgi:rhomboid protease GluP
VNAIKKFHPTTWILTFATLATSITIAKLVGGYPWSTVNITHFHQYGGVTTELLQNGEWWRIATSQLVHVKQGHMLLNVVLLFLLSLYIDRSVGGFRLLTAWLIGGGIGTYASTLFFVSPPWNVGTGSSQALMSLTAFSLVLARKGYPYHKWIKRTVVFTIIANLALDLLFAGYPKPGKIIGFAAGWLIGLALITTTKPDPVSDCVTPT